MKKVMKRLEDALNNAKASMRVEGFTFSKEDDELIMKALAGELNHDDFVKEALKRAENV
ncbi:antitoxin VbhA family protein [Brevibacillus brevis]|uniref:Antitoxin VbhA family protein n=1 Tax=Brevibacillus brevis TaxID=1393 RepID=A0ABY9TCN2_BREBE|nr:antitoxin VbhA family protein [Brevibacillus brevis]WNC17874.1 antitoxin VbhA family protein [Brevibacillus brevis]